MREYDVALSFAGEDRHHAERLAELLRAEEYSVFYDEYELAKLWGKDLYVYLSSVYKDQAEYCVMFLSEYYAQKVWTNHERESAQARAFEENREYILPVRLDDTEIPGILPTVGYLDLRSMTIEEIHQILVEKLSGTISRAATDESTNTTVQNDPNEVEVLPQDADAYFNRGKAYMSENNFNRAIDDFTKAIGLKPDFVEAYHNRGAAYIVENNFNRAVEDFTKAIGLKPDFAQAYHSRGVVHYLKKNFDSAIGDHNIAIALNPNYAIAYTNRGMTYRDKGEYDRAINDFNKAIQLNRNDANAYHNRGLAYSRKGEIGHAIEDFTKAIGLKSDFAKAYYDRGLVWAHLGEWEKAKSDLTTARSMGMNIIVAFHYNYRSVPDFERRNGVKLPVDIVAMLTPQQ